MNATFAVAAREIRERRRLFVVAAALAVVPFLIALMPTNVDRQMIIATAGGFLACAYAWAVAIAQGASTIGRELTEKRFSFYLSKPLSAATIWIGKAAAALLTSIAALLIVVLPTVFATTGRFGAVWHLSSAQMLWWVVVPSAMLFFTAHAVSTMIRSRSMLLAIDFVCAVATVLALRLILRPLDDGGAFGIAAMVLGASLAALGIVLAVAPLWQLSRGRMDAKRNHAALSSVLWPAAAVILAVAGAFVLWFVSPGLSSLAGYHMFEQTPSGEWFVVGGVPANRGNYAVAYVVHAPTKKSERIPARPFPRVGPVEEIIFVRGEGFSRDGSTYAWVEPRRTTLFSRQRTFEVHARRFHGATSEEVNPLILEATPYAFVLSNDGRRLAIVTYERVSVYAVDGWKLLAATQVNRDALVAMFFPSPGVVRILTHGLPDSPLRIQELDLAQRKLTATGEIAVNRHFIVRPSQDGSRMYVWRKTDAVIVDGRTGVVLAELPADVRSPGAMLRDGSVVVAHRRDGALLLSYFDRNGALVREQALPLADAMVTAQLGDRHVLVVQQGNLTQRERKELLVDLQGNEPLPSAANVRGPSSVWSVDPRLAYYEYGVALAAFVERKLVRWNPKSGVKQL